VHSHTDLLLAINVHSKIIGKKLFAFALIFGIRHSNLLEVGPKKGIHNNGLPGECIMYSFYLDIGRIIGNFHFSFVPVGTLGLISPVREVAHFSFIVEEE